MNGESLNTAEELLKKLRESVPQAFSEDKLDLYKLQTLLGDAINNDSERYQLSWAGKSEAYKVLQMPTTATLIPQPEQSVNWDASENIFIEGENLEVLKVLQKSYYGKIKMIYIDPPYNTGSDSFIYPDKFSETKEEYLKRIGDKDEEGYMMKEGLFRKNSKENGQFHSNWLNMMLPRLFLARNLLKEDGVIFVSIDDNEQANLKLLMDEVFGEENFLGQFVWKRRTSSALAEKNISTDHEYVISFAKNKELVSFSGQQKTYSGYSNPDNDPRGEWRADNLTVGMNKDQRPNQYYTLVDPKTQKKYPGNPNRVWAYIPSSMNELISEGKIIFPDDTGKRPMLKRFKNELKNDRDPVSTWLSGVGLNSEGTRINQELLGGNFFNYAKPVSLIVRLVENIISDDDIVLDFFAGSGTTAQAVIEFNFTYAKNAKYICIQLPEKLEERSEPTNNGFESVSDICIARINKVIDKVKSQKVGRFEFNELSDLGFRVYSLGNSNFKIWRGDLIESEAELTKQMELFVTPQRANARSENILWELLIKNGVTLTEKIQRIEAGEGASIYHTSDKRFAFVLDKYTPEVQEKVLALKPRTVICLDSLFQGQDMVKTNAQLKLEDNGITFKTV
jgi:adenine-specific DNA-methyltransferase